MLRLWRERLTACVFPHAGRLYRVRGGKVADWTSSVAAENLEDGLERLLDTYVPRAGATLELIVPDASARLITLPWQNDLVNRQQRQAYAHAYFTHAGFVLGDDYAVEASYHHFGGMGLGLAMPRSLVLSMRERLVHRRIQLRSIMPASAWAYWRADTVRGRRMALLLHEDRRLSAMLFDGKICAGFHTQPIGTGLNDAVLRIKAAIDATLPSISLVQYWSTAENDEQASVIQDAFAATRFEALQLLEQR